MAGWSTFDGEGSSEGGAGRGVERGRSSPQRLADYDVQVRSQVQAILTGDKVGAKRDVYRSAG